MVVVRCLGGLCGDAGSRGRSSRPWRNVRLGRGSGQGDPLRPVAEVVRLTLLGLVVSEHLAGNPWYLVAVAFADCRAGEPTCARERLE
jgi:hypothetical protein